LVLTISAVVSAVISCRTQFALGDFYIARREVGPYSAFYAFRALEDVGFHFGVMKNDKPDWDVMNAALGTSKAKWGPLTKGGN
jgi:hypothetical protein